MRKSKISIDKVQEAFNSAIKRRDMRCLIQDYEACCGQLECSHFYTVGSTPSLRFYPSNAYTQCSKHHWNHHNRDVPFYSEWVTQNHYSELETMERLRHRFIKYTDELKAEIIDLCNRNKLDELKTLIEKELGL